jgi:hypothetical protein
LPVEFFFYAIAPFVVLRGIKWTIAVLIASLFARLVADVDSFLRRSGFHFFDLLALHNMGRAKAPVTSMHTPGLNPYQGQLIEAHGLLRSDRLAF